MCHGTLTHQYFGTLAHDYYGIFLLWHINTLALAHYYYGTLAHSFFCTYHCRPSCPGHPHCGRVGGSWVGWSSPTDCQLDSTQLIVKGHERTLCTDGLAHKQTQSGWLSAIYTYWLHTDELWSEDTDSLGTPKTGLWTSSLLSSTDLSLGLFCCGGGVTSVSSSTFHHH